MVGEVANWCLANGLTIEQADRIWLVVAEMSAAGSPSEFIWQMEWAAKDEPRDTPRTSEVTK